MIKREMNTTQKTIAVTLVNSVLIFFLLLTLPNPAFAQSVGCAVTKVGNPKGPLPSLPPGCQAIANGIAQKAIDLARHQIGKQYIFGAPERNWPAENPAIPGQTPGNFDCSGLTGWSYYWATGGKVRMYGQTQLDWDLAGSNYQKVFYNPSQTAQFLSQLQPGDLLYWSTPSNVHHTAMYIGKALGPLPSSEAPLATTSEYCRPNVTDCFVEAYSTGYPIRETSLGGRMYDLLGFLRPIVK